MKKTRIIVENPELLNTQEIERKLKTLKSLNPKKLIYVWIDVQTEDRVSFNVHKGLLTRLSVREVNSISYNTLRTLRKVQQNYNVTSSFKTLNINYRIA